MHIHTRWRTSRHFEMMWPSGVRVARFNLPPPLGTKGAEYISTTLQAPEPQPDSHTRLGWNPQGSVRATFGPQLFDLFRFRVPKNNKKQ